MDCSEGASQRYHGRNHVSARTGCQLPHCGEALGHESMTPEAGCTAAGSQTVRVVGGLAHGK
jgi:hypothetical protein